MEPTVRQLLLLSSIISLSAILITIVALSDLYNSINDEQNFVIENVDLFRLETDDAWTELIKIQHRIPTISDDRLYQTNNHAVQINPFAEFIARHKRQNYASLPDYCQCDLTPKCPPGLPGPPGENGLDGNIGEPGPPGRDTELGYVSEPPILCPLQPTGCFKCPVGPPGPPGNDGQMGLPGPNGPPGAPSTSTDYVRPGLPGPPGDTGPTGAPGRDGDIGPPGKDSIRAGISQPGPKGISGPPGIAGLNGIDGQPGIAGKMGAPGLPGPIGSPGLPGADGTQGINGTDGLPGNDAQYCPCPGRSPVYVNSPAYKHRKY